MNTSSTNTPRDWKRIVLAVLAVVVVTSGIIVIIRNQPGLQTTSCPLRDATDGDVKEAVALAKDVFEPDQWKLSTGKRPASASVLWLHASNGGLGYLEYLLYDCGYTPTDLKNYYSESNFNIVFQGYKSWKRTAQCTKDDVTLHEFAMTLPEGTDYVARYWIKPINQNRVMDIQVAFPTTQQSLLDTYGNRLFPGFTSCQ